MSYNKKDNYRDSSREYIRRDDDLHSRKNVRESGYIKKDRGFKF